MMTTRLAGLKWLVFGIAVGAVLGAGTVTAITIGADRGDEQRMHSAIERVAAEVTEMVNDGAARQFGVTNQAGDRRVSTVDIDVEDCGAITVSILGEQPPRQPTDATLYLVPDALDSDRCPISFTADLVFAD